MDKQKVVCPYSGILFSNEQEGNNNTWKEIMHATIWRNLENIMQSEISQIQKVMYCVD